MYPIKFENIYYEKIWGGRDFQSFRPNLVEGNIGESWDVACHKNGMSVVSNGQYKGKKLDELIDLYGQKLLGNKCNSKEFPMLVKLINSRDKLSVQVHPNDEYAEKHENQQGKTEAWYVVDSEPNSYLIVGTKDCDKETFKKAIENNETEKYLNKVNVKKGDCFLINSGLVHAICEGTIIAEIQQNSDITYRIYDYGRPREIHVEQSLEVIDFDLNPVNLSDKKIDHLDGYSKGTLCECDYFTIEKYIVNQEVKDSSDEDRFSILTCVDGNGRIATEEGFEENVNKGDSIFIPATMGRYTILGNVTYLKSYV